MKIKKVDDKPMVIYTKQKAKLHTHEPKQAAILGHTTPDTTDIYITTDVKILKE